MYALSDRLVLPLTLGLPFALLLGLAFIQPIHGVAGPAILRAQGAQSAAWIATSLLYFHACFGTVLGVRLAEGLAHARTAPAGAYTLAAGLVALLVALAVRGPWLPGFLKASFGVLAAAAVPAELLLAADPPSAAVAAALLALSLGLSALTRVVPRAAAPDPTAKADPDRTDCLSCGYALDAAALRCAECRTRHHADCFEYAGRCPVPGCSGTWLWAGEPGALELAAREKPGRTWRLEGLHSREAAAGAVFIVTLVLSMVLAMARGAAPSSLIAPLLFGALLTFAIVRVAVDDHYELDGETRTIREHRRFLRTVSRETIATFDDVSRFVAQRHGWRCPICGEESWVYGFEVQLPGRTWTVGSARLSLGRRRAQGAELARALSLIFDVPVQVLPPSAPLESRCYRRCWGGSRR